MDMKELGAKPVEILEKQLREAQARLQELRFQVSANQLKDVRAMREVRKDIARFETVLATKRSAPQVPKATE